jgi:hypothetical protein
MSKTSSILALALFLGMAPAVAISQTTQTPPSPQSTEATQNQPSTGEQAQQPAPGKQPTQTEQPTQSTQSEPMKTPEKTTTTEAPAPKAPETTTTTEAPAPAPSTDTVKAPEPAPSTQAEVKESKPLNGQIILQDENSILASSMIGATVYSPNEEQIGDINDVIVNVDGSVQGIVIGVGGFLGMGEKNVAIEMKHLTLTPRDDGSVRLVLNATKEELENAPEFKSAAEQASEKSAAEDQERAQSQTAVPQQPTTGQ